MVFAFLFIKRDIPLGPEKPAVITEAIMNIVHETGWKFQLAFGLSGCASGLMTVFLTCVFIWRRSLANRVSLRLMFAISLLDFMTNAIQIRPPKTRGLGARCRTYRFFVEFGMFTSIYLSSSIAVNLYMVFLRKNKSQLPRYAEYLYFIVPITVGLLHIAPQQIWSAVHGYCTPGDPVMAGTAYYVLHFFFVLLLLPYLSLLFNIAVSIRVIIHLLTRQRQISASLKRIQARNIRLSEKAAQHTGGSETPGTISDTARTREYERQLRLSQKVNSAALRIALYPLAPLAWVIMMTVFFAMQYSITLTYTSDIPKMLRAAQINWFAYPATTFLNFLVFLTDPIMLNVIREVHRSVTARFFRNTSLNEVDLQRKYRWSSFTDSSTTATRNSATTATICIDGRYPDLQEPIEDERYTLSHVETLVELEDSSYCLHGGVDRASAIYEDQKLAQL